MPSTTAMWSASNPCRKPSMATKASDESRVVSVMMMVVVVFVTVIMAVVMIVRVVMAMVVLVQRAVAVPVPAARDRTCRASAGLR